ncbi:MAG: ATP-dependent acyl-CoA ligase [Comamonas sp. SCN 65-56]|uniref:ATP-dependent acyl-CoA ligase n=1 Tax=Comamonas sp. SCN 65-56 TaxID=1660095 RepID=UPI00086C6596|nr:ATP-dependent acyl-CoA ligase [Comamonas sp. SCN 65-56]ODS93444.1 MAG: ATP-dependent acyl-CoA ligase [Comamonas sp. SCN 65-56]
MSDAIARFAPAERTLPAMLAQQCARFAERTLLVCGETRWSYVHALGVAQRMGALLKAHGIQAGDRVALMCGNRPEFLQVFLGCAWIGAITVPINTSARGANLRHILSNSGARLFIGEGATLPALAGLEGRESLALQAVWSVDGSSIANAQPMPALGDALTDPAAITPGHTLAILYTSGTTGLSKGVCCPHAQYYWWSRYSSELLGLRDGDVLLTTLPLFHTNALNAFFQALLTGSTLVAEARFSASDFWAALVRHQATVTYVLGAMVPILLSKESTPQDRAHQVRIALAPAIPTRFHDVFSQRFGMALLDGYGSTESNFVIGLHAEQKPGSMGRLVPGFEARVADEWDEEVPDGTSGELLLRATEPFAFASGYFGMPEKTVEAWRNLWFHTGDRVVRDADGFYTFLDRLKDAIRRRGENISSYEVEQVLLSHPAVALAAVFPVQSELAEDEVMAAIVAREGQVIDPVELIRYCEPRMAYFAVPRFLEFMTELPSTESGKIQKFKLRERGTTATTWDREAAGIKVKR